MKALLLLVSVLVIFPTAFAAEKPNILWITSEDNDYGWLGCYGNKEAQTPRLDKLAANGLLFSRAYSNAPVCAVARSTILNGAYAVTQGTQHMRSRHPLSSDYTPYPTYLRKLGYYCTNNAKTDYNFLGNDKSLWDDCSGKAHYKNRPEGSPFFAIFNLGVSHESSLFNVSKKKGKTRINPADVTLRPYLPDLPEIRNDVAHYHDIITRLDTQVGKLLDELEKEGLADNTIVFYYGDHGGITPRGKRYLKDSGTHVPMLVHMPQKWQHLCPFKPGQKVDEPVAFVDLAPTLLSLVGLEKPSQMQGRAFLGTKRTEPAKDRMVFLYADRFDEIYGMRRGLTDGRWKYIRRFTPHLPAAPYSYYQFGQAGWRAWQQAWKNGKLKGRSHDIWEANQPVEELFDLKSDPWEVNNLAADPAHAKRLADMRDRLRKTMIETRDTGVIPEPMFAELAPNKPVSNYLSSRSNDLPSIVDLAFAASARDPKHLDLFIRQLGAKDPITRYWAAQGLLILGSQASSAAPQVALLLNDSQSTIRVTAGQFLFNIGKKEQGTAAVLAELNQRNNEYAQQYAMNALTRIGAINQIPDSWITATLNDGKAGSYVQRLAQQLAKQRNLKNPQKKPKRKKDK
ncbi:MAG: sulfatase [Akkermansiaceae bacterium]|nr:sulfatase [Akkermansiaceae bacterium]